MSDGEREAWENREASDNARRSGQFSVKAQRVLVRVLLALRGEARRSPDPDFDTRRAEALADRILLDFPRRVLPLGLAALAAILLFCMLPFVRDTIRQGSILPSQVVAAEASMTSAVESGLRQRGSEMSDGFETLKAIVVPFASDDAPLEVPVPAPAPTPSAQATAPFKAS